MLIRPESLDDAAAIEGLTMAAFDGHPHSDGSEPGIIRDLRAAGALSLSLVAEHEGQVIGHLAFSAVNWCDQPDWYGLGPVSVLPDHQSQGIGSALIREGLRQIRDRGARGCVVMGDPAYYQRFGFRQNPALTYPGVPEAYFMALSFADLPDLSGPVRYHPAFG